MRNRRLIGLGLVSLLVAVLVGLPATTASAKAKAKAIKCTGFYNQITVEDSQLSIGQFTGCTGNSGGYGDIFPFDLLGLVPNNTSPTGPYTTDPINWGNGRTTVLKGFAVHPTARQLSKVHCPALTPQEISDNITITPVILGGTVTSDNTGGAKVGKTLNITACNWLSNNGMFGSEVTLALNSPKHIVF